jgi:hypothetical protein
MTPTSEAVEQMDKIGFYIAIVILIPSIIGFALTFTAR